MDEAEERRIWKRDAAELRRSEVYPALLRFRMLLAWVERVLRSLDTSAP